jgi:S-(hydroxymethyl)mycothiol dehydrogenase
MQQVKAVVAKAKGAPVELVTTNVPDPGPGEAVVKVQACGVCHTDLHYREGGINDDFPFLLGHEASGVVEAVGPEVTGLEPGDFVVLNWRAVCGDCRACNRGEPWYCFATFNATQKMTLEDGTELSPALGIGAFAEKTLVAAGQCTKVDPAVPATTAGLLGCGVMAGFGAAVNTGGVQRDDTVAVLLFQETRLPPTNMQYPDVDFLSSAQLAQSESQYPSILKCPFLRKINPLPGALFRYLRIWYTASM